MADIFLLRYIVINSERMVTPIPHVRFRYRGDRIVGLIGEAHSLRREGEACDAGAQASLQREPGSTRLAIAALARAAAALQRAASQHDALSKADTLTEIGNARRGLTIAKDIFTRAIEEMSEDKPARACKFGTIVQHIARSETTLRAIERDLRERTTQ